MKKQRKPTRRKRRSPSSGDICWRRSPSRARDELGLQPTVFHRWQKEFFENGAAAFEQKARLPLLSRDARVFLRETVTLSARARK